MTILDETLRAIGLTGDATHYMKLQAERKAPLLAFGQPGDRNIDIVKQFQDAVKAERAFHDSLRAGGKGKDAALPTPYSAVDEQKKQREAMSRDERLGLAN